MTASAWSPIGQAGVDARSSVVYEGRKSDGDSPFRGQRPTRPIACLRRPEMKAERVSYEVMTPSAARGILKSVLWKPAIAWRVHSIAVLAPIAWVSFRRNEG